MSQSLFTSQTPTSGNNSDGTPGITTATSVMFAKAGTVAGIRWYCTTTPGGVWTGMLWEVTASDPPGGGTLLASATFVGTPTGGTWNSVLFSSPVSVSVGGPGGKLYRAGMFSGDGRYVATPSFFGSDLINGDITAPHNGDNPTGLGSVNQGCFTINASPTYPASPASSSCYFVDVLFDAAGTEVDLAASFTGTGSMSAALTVEKLLAANFTATGSMSATLTTEKNLAAALTGTGSMSAAVTREVTLAANFTATAGMSAAFETHLAANLTASASMSATLTVPHVGPVDPIATPVAEQLLACLTEQMNTLPSPPERIQLRVGAETGPMIGPNVDECCAGLAWVRVANVYPSWDSFPGPDNTWVPCGPYAYAVVLEMGSAFCMPWSDSDDTFDNTDPPNTGDWAAAFDTLMLHQTLMRRAAACCFLPTQRRAVGEWTPLSVEGGCTGGTLRVTVSVMAPCRDC